MSLADLTTEGRNPRSTDLDRLSPLEIVQLMNAEDAGVPAAVAAVREQIAKAIEIIADQLRAGGRLIYLGAGTSGRLGVLDAAECPPTFNSPPWQVVGLIAGGLTALTRAVEGAEDHEELGRDDLEQIDCSTDDVIVGIATSGRTPYVIGGMKYATSLGCHVIGLSCNEDSGLRAHCELEIAPIVGPEIVTGSTRLKAGTATKLVLNLLSTGAMVLLGKTYGNLMVDLQLTNEKLADRSERIVAELAGVSRSEAAKLLERCDGDVKTAIVAHRHQIPAGEARKLLQHAQGRLRTALETQPQVTPSTQEQPVPLILGVDGGGTTTRAWLAERGSDLHRPWAVGEAGSANPHAVGTAAALANIGLAIRRAFKQAGTHPHPVDAACLAIAGTGSEQWRHRLSNWARQQQIAANVTVTHDAMAVLAAGTQECVGIALIAGTGSLAFGRAADGRVSRAGGWGHLLGDQGGGYDIARQALRAAVKDLDGTGRPTELTDALGEQIHQSGISDFRDFATASGTDVGRVSSLAPLVVAAAESGDAVATDILQKAAGELALLVETVAASLFPPDAEVPLALAGSLLLNAGPLYDEVLARLTDRSPCVLPQQLVSHPSVGALFLARDVYDQTGHNRSAVQESRNR